MSAAEVKNSDGQKPGKSTAVLLFTIAADTTWRMFIPIIAGTALGIQADHSFGSKPVATIVGMFAGVIIAALLVRQQLKGGSHAK